MNFLEAHRVLSNFKGGASLPLRLLASGNVDPLQLYIRAAAAARGRSADVTTLPFGTLGQALLALPTDHAQEVLLLMPWDFVPECDWRSGIPRELSAPAQLLESAQIVARRVSPRRAKILFVPAPLPPVYSDPAAVRSLAAGIAGCASAIGAHFLSPDCFGLGNYLASGVPIAGPRTSEVVDALINVCLELPEGTSKVLVTDLDHVMWAGLAGEDGPEGVHCGAEGIGFRHFLYQGCLAKLKVSGVLLAAVSRNDLALARAPIVSGRTLLSESDFVEILASFEPKSVHLRRLARSLNLGMDAFVFVDDNPIELAEVGAALPDVRCVQFPARDDELPQFLNTLAALFARRTITDEDRRRTEMYRRRLAADVSSVTEQHGADIRGFLAELKMELTIFDQSVGDRDRAVQLINKTNQFNLNGRRLADEHVAKTLAAGGKLYTARLDDRTGSHGEILACLIDSRGRILSFVLSCRAFQRRVEHAFFSWLVKRRGVGVPLAYAATERNTPMREFLNTPAFVLNGEDSRLDGTRFLADHASALELFSVKEVGID